MSNLETTPAELVRRGVEPGADGVEVLTARDVVVRRCGRAGTGGFVQLIANARGLL